MAKPVNARPAGLSAYPPGLEKVVTGIAGLDEITGGGLPKGRTTLVLGGAGCGKTVLALQTLVSAATNFGARGVFVAFEESSRRIAANAAGFAWDLRRLRHQIHFLDARPTADLALSGSFDLIGLLASLDAKISELGAKRVVFDAVDAILALLDNPIAVRTELYRLNEWILDRGITALITAKKSNSGTGTPAQVSELVEYMTDCVIMLNHDLFRGVSQRTLRVRKYRGSRFAENESPFVISSRGIEVAGWLPAAKSSIRVTDERVSSGVEQLDSMLGGGYFRSSSILVSGAPGTAKTTLAGAFTEAACLRGEAAVIFTFDSEPAELIRNLSSVGIQLKRFADSGLLRIHSGSSRDGSAETQYLRIRTAIEEHQARRVVIDPLSALCKEGNEVTAFSVVERLTRWAKQQGVTLLSTSLLDPSAPELEGTPLQISTIADTWIQLSYRAHAGERNRALTVIKSRGTRHSNQVRELILSDGGITLADVFTAGGEVLMGTLRWEKEQAEREEQKQRRLALEVAIEQVAEDEADLARRVSELRRELAAKRKERRNLLHAGQRQNATDLKAKDERERRRANVPLHG